MAASPPEEIARQHKEAMALVGLSRSDISDIHRDDDDDDGNQTTSAVMPCSPDEELGEISLDDKVRPTWPLPPASARTGEEEKKDPNDGGIDDGGGDGSSATFDPSTLKNPKCISTRGHVDVTELQEMIREGYNLSYSGCLAPPRRKDGQLPSKAASTADTNGGTADASTAPPPPPPPPKLSPTNYWDPRNASKYNVMLTRPSHDGWGIGKIVLVFCDDFLTKVYELPWWKEFQPALQPILDVLAPPPGTAELLVVRALFASLPPGVTIPIHNDTGEWVKTTHRVHVPILVNDPSKVLFRCGPAPHLLQRIDCTPGHIFEMNNQAKHAVSNCDSDSRVHLILDYQIVGKGHDYHLEQNQQPRQRLPAPPPSPVIVLQAGERLVQTRRSIDRLSDIRQRPTPSYIILGAQKSGTTSLYDYINQHPWVARARRRETHCLDWRWNDALATPEQQLKHCQRFFYTQELKNHPSCLTGDSTPSYLLDSRRVIPRISAVFAGWSMKFFVMMRDPVRRAASHYAMVTSPDGTPEQLAARGGEWRGKSLWDVVEMELTKMDECGLIPYWNRQDGVVDEKTFDDFAGSDEERGAWDLYLERHVPLNTGSYGLLTRGMYALQLRPWFRAFARDQILCLKLESMKSTGIPTTMQKVWAHLDLPNHPVNDESAKNTRDYQPMDETVQRYLQRFFEPHNRVLASVLGEDRSDQWENPWPYDQ